MASQNIISKSLFYHITKASISLTTPQFPKQFSKSFSKGSSSVHKNLISLCSVFQRVAIKDNIFKNGEFRAAYRVKQGVDCLRKHGLMYIDAFTVMRKEPRVVLYEIEEIEEKIDFLHHKMKFEIQCLVEVRDNNMKSFMESLH